MKLNLSYSDVKKALKEVIEQGEIIQNVKSPIHLNKIFEEMYSLKEEMSEKNNFPSLDKSRAIILWNSGEWTRDGVISRKDDTAFTLADIERATVNKSVLRKKADDLMILYKNGDFGIEEFVEELLKEETQ